MYVINMMSKADIVKGHGVLSAYEEQTALAKEMLAGRAQVVKNQKGMGDIIHYHSINPELYVTIPFMKKRGITVGYVHFLPETVENSIKLPKLFKKIFYRYMLRFYRKMDYLVTVNPCFVDKLAAYHIPREKVFYIPNFVSEEEFYPMAQAGTLEASIQCREARQKYDLKTDTFTVLCVGQLQKRKGVMDFVEVAKQLPQMQFVWAGGFSFGKITDGYEEIRELAEHLPENVKFLGMVDRKKMNELYNMADVMFLPSYEELFPMTILEAMNCAVPIVVRDLELYEPILFDHAVKGKSNEEFVQILTELMNQPQQYTEASNRAFSGHLRYSRETVGAMWRAFYEFAYERKEEGARTYKPRRKRGRVQTEIQANIHANMQANMQTVMQGNIQTKKHLL